MDSVEILKRAFNETIHLSEKEKEIIKYFKKNSSAIETITIKELKSNIKMSMSVLYRFMNRCHYASYRKFIFDLRDIINAIPDDNSNNLNSSILDYYLEIIAKNQRMQNYTKINESVDLILNAKKVMIYSTDSSNECLNDIIYRLNLFNISVENLSSNTTTAVNQLLLNSQENSILIVINNNQNMALANFFCQTAKNIAIKTILVTTNLNSNAIDYASVSHKIISSSSNSLLELKVSKLLGVIFVFDLIISEIINRDPGKIKDLKQKLTTTDIINKIK